MFSDRTRRRLTEATESHTVDKGGGLLYFTWRQAPTQGQGWGHGETDSSGSQRAELTNLPHCADQSPVWMEPRFPAPSSRHKRGVQDTQLWGGAMKGKGYLRLATCLPVMCPSHHPSPTLLQPESHVPTLSRHHLGTPGVHDRGRPLLPPDAQAGEGAGEDAQSPQRARDRRAARLGAAARSRTWGATPRKRPARGPVFCVSSAWPWDPRV